MLSRGENFPWPAFILSTTVVIPSRVYIHSWNYTSAVNLHNVNIHIVRVPLKFNLARLKFFENVLTGLHACPRSAIRNCLFYLSAISVNESLLARQSLHQRPVSPLSVFLLDLSVSDRSPIECLRSSRHHDRKALMIVARGKMRLPREAFSSYPYQSCRIWYICLVSYRRSTLSPRLVSLT